MSRRSIVVALAAVLALAVGVVVATQAPAGNKHSHGVPVKQFELPIVTGPGEVNGDVVFCPAGYTATGGGVTYEDGLGVIASAGFGDTRSYAAIIDNFDSSFTSVMNVQVACVKGTSKAKARTLTREQLREAPRDDIAALEEAHRKAE